MPTPRPAQEEQTAEQMAEQALDERDASGLEPPLPEDTPLPSSQKPFHGRRRVKLTDLPDNDPFILIDGLNELGGKDGSRPRMFPRAMAAFRSYCLLSPHVRTIARLRMELARELELAHAQACEEARKQHLREPAPDPVPTIRRLTDWQAKFGWEALVADYDLHLARWRLAGQESTIAELNARQQRVARALQNLASNMAADIIRDYNKPAGDPKSWPVNPRTGRPVPPKRSLAGLQGVAQLYKTAVETERVAAGAPTVITNAQVQQDVHLSADTGPVSLEAWRQRTYAERLAHPAAMGNVGSGSAGQGPAALGTGGSGGAHRGGPRALPVPAALLDELDETERDELPEEWFAGGAVVEADTANPLDAAGRARTSDGEQDDAPAHGVSPH